MRVRLVRRKTSTFHDFPYEKPQRKCIHCWIVNVTPPGRDHCSHGCVYCYARDAVFSRDGGGALEVYSNLPELVARDLDRISLCPPVSLSNITDPCQAVPELRRQVARLVGLLVERNVSFFVVTKGDARFLLDVAGFAAHPRAMVATTIEGPPEVLERLSPAAPPFAQRLASVRAVAGAGVRASVRLDPVFPPLYRALYGEGWLGRIEALLGEVARAGCRHVIGSTGRLSRRPPRGRRGRSLFERMERVVGEVDARAAEEMAREYVFDRSGTSAGYLWRRPARVVFHRRVRAACEARGMTYATCQETPAEETDSPGLPNCEGVALPFCVKGLDGRFEPIEGCTALCHGPCREMASPPCGRRELTRPAPLRIRQLR
ncbi:MAG: hypothetical protein ACLF0G_09815 [Candidatus Brocadiia bacterium]